MIDFKKYETLLEKVKTNPLDSTSVLDLAVLCESLHSITEAQKYYKMVQLPSWEEKFFSLNRLGVISKSQKRYQEAFNYFLEAYEIDDRVEPLLELASMFIEQQNWKQAYLFLEMAISLNPPKQEERKFVIDIRKYEYLRWHLMGIVAYYVGEYQTGILCCKKAIDKSISPEEKQLNKKNLEFYKERK